MALEHRPAPVITIVDPRHPGVVREPDPDVAPRARLLQRRESALVTVVVLLLLAGATSTGKVREQIRLADRLAGLELGATFGGGVVNEGSGVSARLLLFAGNGTAIAVSRVVLDNGWVPVGSPVTNVADGSLATLLVTQSVDCTRVVRAPTTLRLTATIDGGGSRTLVLPVRRPVPGVLPEARRLCGDVEADSALLLSSSSVLATESGTRVELRLLNRGLDEVRVLGARYPGFRLVARSPVPAVLPGRAPGLLDTSVLPVHRLLLVPQVTDCGRARAALDASRRTSPPDLLEVEVDGRGGPATTLLDVQGLLAFLEAEWTVACR